MMPGGNCLVMCETQDKDGNPHPTNHRSSCAEVRIIFFSFVCLKMNRVLFSRLCLGLRTHTPGLALNRNTLCWIWMATHLDGQREVSLVPKVLTTVVLVLIGCMVGRWVTWGGGGSNHCPDLSRLWKHITRPVSMLV